MALSKGGGGGGGGERHVNREIFHDSDGFLGVSYCFVGMIMTVTHGPGLKQNFFVHTRCSNPFPRFLVLLSSINAAFD